MQDVYKFRAWDKEKNVLVYDIENCFDDWDCQNFYDYIIKDRYVVEQCTGLKDKEGKFIYDNDLIMIGNKLYRVAVDDFGCRTVILNNNPFTEVIEWSDIVKQYYFYNRESEIEVIGNIRENKYLLENKDENHNL